MINQKIGSFWVDAKLGAGGMGIVYRAKYIRTGQPVALKVLPHAFSTKKQRVVRFKREMAILKKLRHPNIVRYYGRGKHADQRYYVMELMEGGSMRDVLEQNGRLSWEDTINYGRQICAALEYTHRHGIIHRDLKPGNLFVSKDGKLKLADFGIAGYSDGIEPAAAGRRAGTYGYMAPEQIRGKPPLSPKADFYALGCVLYEMLTGRTPFRGDSRAQLLERVLSEDPLPVTRLAAHCPIWLESLVMQLLEKDPHDRPADAPSVAAALQEAGEKAANSFACHRNRSEMVELLKDLKGKKSKEKDKEKSSKGRAKPQGPFYERVWFLAACLLLLAGGAAWTVWPMSEHALFEKAEALMSSDDPNQWNEARDRYLAPLLERFPNGQYAAGAREHIEKIETERAKRRAMATARLGREPSSEAERLFLDAWRFEQFGDRVTAAVKYRSMVELLKDRPQDRAFVTLARRQLATLDEAGESNGNRVEFVNRALGRAKQLFDNGQVLKAHKIWDSIVTLYGDNREFEPQVDYARDRLAGRSSEMTDDG